VIGPAILSLWVENYDGVLLTGVRCGGTLVSYGKFPDVSSQHSRILANEFLRVDSIYGSCHLGDERKMPKR